MLKALSETVVYSFFLNLFKSMENPTPSILRFLLTLVTFFGCRLGVKPFSRYKSPYYQNKYYNQATNTNTSLTSSPPSSPNLTPRKMEVEDSEPTEYELITNLVDAIRRKCNAIMALGLIDVPMMKVLYDSEYQDVECIQTMHTIILSWTRIGREL